MKLVKPSIPVYSADGKRSMIGVTTLRILKESGRIAQLIQRKRDKAVTRAYLKAEPNEIASRITAEPTVVKVLPQTWTHRESLRIGL